MAKRITFPKVSGTNVWRNAETGIEIRKSERDNGDGTYYMLMYPGPTDAIGYWGAERALKEARELATERVETVREQIAEAHDEAEAEEVQRESDERRWKRGAIIDVEAEAHIENALIRNFLLSMIGAACAAPEQVRAWVERHGIGWTLTAIWAALAADRAEAERIDRQLSAHDDHARKQFPSVFAILDA